MPQQVLGWMVRFRVRDRLAERQDITVTPADVQKALNAITAQIRQGGNTATLSEVAVANGLPPDMLSDLGRYQAIETKLLNRLDGGKLPSQTSAQQALQTRSPRRSAGRPRAWTSRSTRSSALLDYSNYAVVPAPTTLSTRRPRPPRPPPPRRSDAAC